MQLINFIVIVRTINHQGYGLYSKPSIDACKFWWCVAQTLRGTVSVVSSPEWRAEQEIAEQKIGPNHRRSYHRTELQRQNWSIWLVVGTMAMLSLYIGIIIIIYIYMYIGAIWLVVGTRIFSIMMLVLLQVWCQTTESMVVIVISFRIFSNVSWREGTTAMAQEWGQYLCHTIWLFNVAMENHQF